MELAIEAFAAFPKPGQVEEHTQRTHERSGQDKQKKRKKKKKSKLRKRVEASSREAEADAVSAVPVSVALTAFSPPTQCERLDGGGGRFVDVRLRGVCGLVGAAAGTTKEEARGTHQSGNSENNAENQSAAQQNTLTLATLSRDHITAYPLQQTKPFLMTTRPLTRSTTRCGPLSSSAVVCQRSM